MSTRRTPLPNAGAGKSSTGHATRAKRSDDERRARHPSEPDVATEAPVDEANQRGHPRVDASRIVLRIQSAAHFREAYLRDLSMGGLFVKTDKTFPIGTAFTIELWPPEKEEALVLPAEVVRWQEESDGYPAGMGMKFSRVPEEAARRLEALIEEYADLPPPDEDGFVQDRVVGLIADLATARTRIEALVAENGRLRSELDELERDESASRALADRLASEKASAAQQAVEELGALQKRLDAGAAEAQSLEGQLAQAQRERASAVEALGAAQQRLEAAQAQLADQRIRLEKETAALAAKVRRADQLEAEVEKRRTRERELRRLLSAVGTPPGEAKGKRQAGDDPRKDEAEILIETSEEEFSPPAASAPEPAAGHAESAFAAPPSTAAAVPGWGEGDGVLDLDEIGGVPEDFERFQRSLAPTTRLVPADGLRAREAASEVEAIVRELLEAAPTFQTLLNQIHGKVAEDRLRRILFDLHGSDLVSLRG